MLIAVAAGKELISKLGMSHLLPYIDSRVDEFEVLPHHVVFVASLVQGKISVVTDIPVGVSNDN